ncbi:hypothetical protein FB479_103710 [Brevibacillus sp. AG162]|nr:hypothetical protein FB479_103710 [Brevibacillus sp. AG162]
MQDGCLAYEYHKNKKQAEKLQTINSCTKSFISVLIGIALDQGLIAVCHPAKGNRNEHI